MRRVLQTAAPLVLGLVGGGLAVQLFADAPAPSDADPVPVATKAKSPSERSDEAVLERLRRLERLSADGPPRISVSTNRATANPVDDEDAEAARWEASLAMDEDEARARAEEEFGEYVEQHEDEPVDPDWAAEANAAFSDGIERLGESHDFELVSLECRSSSCLAQVEWPTQTAAQSHWGALLHEPYGMNCSRGVLVSQPEEPGGTTSARVLFEC